MVFVINIYKNTSWGETKEEMTTIDLKIEFDSNTKETIFQFKEFKDTSENVTDYKFRLKLSPEEINQIISGFQQWRKKEMLK